MRDHHKTALRAYMGQDDGPAPTWLPNRPKAIKKFQGFHGLEPDGIVGPRTRKVMKRTNTRLGTPPPMFPPQETFKS